MSRRPAFPFALLRFWAWRLALGWSLIAGMTFLFQVAICGAASENQNIQVFLAFVNLLPGAIREIIGKDALAAGNTAYIVALAYEHPLELILHLTWAAGVPTGLLVGEVQRGHMELILSRAATKTQVYLCAALLTLGGLLALAPVFCAATALGSHLFHYQPPLPIHRFWRLALNFELVCCATASVGLLAGSFFHRRNRAIGVVVAYAVVDQFILLFSAIWPRLKFLSNFSLFHYAKRSEIFNNPEWPLGDMAVLAVIAVSVTLVGAVLWKRHDLPS
jgi:hypothetical protein